MAAPDSISSALRSSFDQLVIAVDAYRAFLQAVDEAGDTPPAWLIASQALFTPVVAALDHQDALLHSRVLPSIERAGERQEVQS